LVTERGRLMDEQAEKHPGAMSAVMRFDPQKLEPIVAEVAKSEPVLIANHNSPSQLVISGSLAGIELAEKMIREQGGRPIRLKVSGAWHSELMRDAEQPLNKVIDEIEFSDAKMPVIMNVTGELETDGEKIKDNLKRQMCSGVRWYQGIQQAWIHGARTFIEVGPKGVLAKMLRGIVPDPPAMNAFVIDTPVALQSFFEEDEEDLTY